MDSLISYSDSDEESGKAATEKPPAKEGQEFSLVQYEHDDLEQDQQVQREDGPNGGGIVRIHRSPEEPFSEKDQPSEGEASQSEQASSPFPRSTSEADRLVLAASQAAPISLPSLEEVLPPKPDPSLCSDSLKQKVQKFHEMKAKGQSINRQLSMSHQFKNPDILEKLIAYCDIFEIGSNYPKEIYDPLAFEPSSFYDELAKEQQLIYDKREMEKQGRTAIEFVSSRQPTQTVVDSSFAPVSTATSSAISTGKKQKPVVQRVVGADVTTNSKASSPRHTQSASASSTDKKDKRKKSKWDQTVSQSDQPQQQQPAASVAAAPPPPTAPLLPVDAYAEYVKEKKREAEKTKAETAAAPSTKKQKTA